MTVTVNAEKNALITLMDQATLLVSPKDKIVNSRPTNRDSGVPGECGTCNLKAEAINSEQSHKLAVGSRVKR
jgi:hypothetical protein